MSDVAFLSVRGGLFWQQEGPKRTATGHLPAVEVTYSYRPNLCPACGTEPWLPARVVTRTIKGSQEHFPDRYTFFVCAGDGDGHMMSDVDYFPATDTSPAYFSLRSAVGDVRSQEEAYELIEWDYGKLASLLKENARCIAQ